MLNKDVLTATAKTANEGWNMGKVAGGFTRLPSRTLRLLCALCGFS
jgi:hypothetical protein